METTKSVLAHYEADHSGDLICHTINSCPYSTGNHLGIQITPDAIK